MCRGDEKTVVGGNDGRRHAPGQVGLVIDDEVDAILKEPRVVGAVDSPSSTSISGYAVRTRRIQAGRIPAISRAPASMRGAQPLRPARWRVRRSVALRRRERRKREECGPRGWERCDLWPPAQEAHAELALQTPHLGVYTRLRDGIRILARSARKAARQGHAIKAL